MKTAMQLIMFILLISIATSSYDECQSIMTQNELPCQIFLPSTSSCAAINVSVYYNNTYIYNTTMQSHVPTICSVELNRTTQGVYSFVFSTNDNSAVTIQSATDSQFLFWVIALLFILFLIWSGFKNENVWLLSLAGMGCCVIAISLFFGDYPLITNDLFKNWIVVIFSGIGFFLMLAPIIDWLGEHFG